MRLPLSREGKNKTQEPDGTVICKKCGKPVAISNPSEDSPGLQREVHRLRDQEFLPAG